ncbi:17585_t:CDS:2 [Acaulospora morrowiae]|uniref:17585_t:CDS:1 n=1 Tax=Acaulospora morrowiae TaxID=94023 RepID=A0A9N9HVS4_9GLOM|nr:17585_t:CDS:2 [Acaulospora morrowiae]
MDLSEPGSIIFEREKFLSANSTFVNGNQETTATEAEAEEENDDSSDEQIFLPGDSEEDDDLIVISGKEYPKTGFEEIIEKIGMGKFQKRLLWLCGFGWFADNLWFQATSIILPRVQTHFQVSNSIIGLLPSSIILGMMFGAIFWGVFSDTFGRKQAFNWTLAMTAMFGLISSLSQNFTQICISMFFLGASVGGNLPVDGAIFLEFVPKDKQYLLTFMSVFWPFGSVVTSVIAYFILPPFSCPENGTTSCDVHTHNNGWKYLLAICGTITFIMFISRILFFRLRESPKFLIVRNRKQEAVDVLREIARINGRDISIHVSDLTTSGSDDRTVLPMTYPFLSSVKQPHKKKFTNPASFLRNCISLKLQEIRPLFTPKWIRTTILVWLFWSLNSVAFNMFNTFLPKFLENQETRNESNNDSSKVITEVLKDYIIFSICGVPGSLIGTYLIETPLGRIYTMSLGAFGSSLSVFLFAIFDSRAWSITCNVLFNILNIIEYSVIYGYTAEVFETRVRGTANGIASACARVAGMAGPIIAGNLLAISITLPLYVSAAAFFLVGVCMISLPIETRGRQAL